MPYEMLRIDPSFIMHEFNVMCEPQPVKQKGKRSEVEHVDVVIEEVEKLREKKCNTRSSSPKLIIQYGGVKKNGK